MQVTALKESTPCTFANKLIHKNALYQLLAQFSSTCKRYTDVMALKHLFLCHLFNNSHLETTIISELTNLIINLQKAAIKLQAMEVGYFNGVMCLW